jgi:uncharacterized protein YrrD
MEIKENAGVYAAGGEKIGEVDRVVIDPRTREVSHLVTRKGLLFTREKVIPLDSVIEAEGDRIVLEAGANDPDWFPDFEEEHYLPSERLVRGGKPGAGYARPFLFYYPRTGKPWWGSVPGYPPPNYVPRTERNIPAGTVPLDEGARVMSHDGKKAGKVTRVFTEPDEKRVTHLVISRGLLSKVRKLITTDWVKTVSDGAVHLSVDKDVIDQLPEYSEE